MENSRSIILEAKLFLIGMFVISGIFNIVFSLVEQKRLEYESLVNRVGVRADINNNGVLESAEAESICDIKKTFL